MIKREYNGFWDRENGLGCVPNQTLQNVSYFGFEAKMKASTFLLLSADAQNKDLSYLEEKYNDGDSFGFPFLGIDWYGDEDEPLKENKWKVNKHEGRHRAELFIKKHGDIDITVSIFTSTYSNELRNRHLREDMFYKGIKIYPQRGAKYENKSFDISDMAQPEFFDFNIGKKPKQKEKDIVHSQTLNPI